DNLLINIDGGTTNFGENNALVIANSFGATLTPLGANQFAVVNKGIDGVSGTVRVFTNFGAGPVQFPDINYTNIHVVSPQVSAPNGPLNPNLLIMGPDTNEPNESLGTATFLGSGSTIQVQHAAIFPNTAEFPGVPADQDFYKVVAQVTGTLDFQVFFRVF